MTRNSAAARIYGSDRPDRIPAYSAADCARFLCLPVSTVRSWFQGTRTFKPLLRYADERRSLLSFENMVEVYVLRAIRERHGIKMPAARKAIGYLQQRFDSKHPLAEQQMLTDGRDVLVEHYGRLVSASSEGQLAMKRILEQYLVRVERSPAGIPLRLFPVTRETVDDAPQLICIDPLMQFGRPCIARTGIPTEVVVDRFLAGESTEELARDYGRPLSDIEEAIRYERQAQPRAA